MIRLPAAALAALFIAASPLAGLAQDVTLTSRDGAVSVDGALLGYDGEFYRVDTKFGELTLDGSGVTCSGPGCPDLTAYVAELTFSGAAPMAETLMPALIEGFALRNGYQAAREVGEDGQSTYVITASTGTLLGRIHLRATTTDEGFADLLANEADAVLALREIRAEEVTRAREAGMGDMTGPGLARVLALDALVPVVAPGLPVDEISPRDLARILAGEIVSWAELGGPEAPIAIHMPKPGSGLSQAAEDRLLRPGGLAAVERIRRHDSGAALAEAVADDPFALGLTSFAERGGARVLTLTGGCGFTLAPSRRTIKTEDYPLSTPMFLYLPARRLPALGREFLAYARSPLAQLVIRRAGLIDQAPEEVPMDVQGDRFANAILAAGGDVAFEEVQRMVRTLRGLRRLTLSFRFETGSSRPDAQSRANIAELAHALEAGDYDGRRLVFVGFSDSEGPAEANRRIAMERASAVRDAVTEAAEAAAPDRTEIAVAAFGEALPMACDDSGWGRGVNRRVEVWVR